MEAELFCVDYCFNVSELLNRLISTYLDPSIRLNVINFERHPEKHELGKRYEQLVQASFPLALNLSLSVMTYGPHPVYIYLYGPILTKGSKPEFLSFYPKRGLEAFLPALAIRDRMVLMPPGQGKLLEKMSSEKVVHYDMHEVDFSDEAALTVAMRLVAQEVQQEIGHELKAYSSFIQGVVNVKQAAEELQLPPRLLTRVFQEETDAIASIYEMLSCDLEQQTLLRGRWTKTVLIVRNESDRELHGITVKAAGPIELLPRNIKVDLPAHSTVPIEISIRSSDPGDFPLEISFALQEDRALEDWLPVHHIWMQSIVP